MDDLEGGDLVKLRLKPETKLERRVARWLHETAGNYPNTGIYGVLADLRCDGSQSGMVSHLINTRDTTAFYRRYRTEIDVMLGELIQDCGRSLASIFKHWDESDPLANEAQNRNVLAWFGFEEAARRLMERAKSKTVACFVAVSS